MTQTKTINGKFGLATLRYVESCESSAVLFDLPSSIVPSHWVCELAGNGNSFYRGVGATEQTALTAAYVQMAEFAALTDIQG